MVDTYKIAVIIPCWNSEQYIAEMLECLMNQTLEEWRAICVDDHCTDNTAKVIRDYQQRDNRIQYYKRNREPKGAPACRNIGLELALGAKYVVFFDSDDLIPAYCLEQRVEYLEQHPSLDIATFPTKAFYSKYDDDTRWGFGRKYFSDTIESLLNWRTLQMVGVSNVFRRCKVEECGLLWDENLRSMQDADFNISSMLLGMRQEFVPNAKYDYFYRQVNASISKQIKSEDHIKSHIYLISKNINRLKSRPGYDFILRAYVVTMIDFFSEHPKYIVKLYKNTWIRNQIIFTLKLKILQLTKLRGKRFLFRKETIYCNMRAESWSHFMANDIEKCFNK